MSDIAVKVENLGKMYHIGAKQEQYATLRSALVSGMKRLTTKRSAQEIEANTLWALKDVSFEIKQGEVVGIIGRNGAGKSTLLKVLAHITEPTKGRVSIYGRVGSLLEVGTGFHPELTGRDNIYLNGAILGMKRAEIQSKFDEIVSFAEIEKFLDTPVKRYSSGMYVRLAFAVAAHLEPEILVVDEVLAVGDAEFQKKCLGKMEGVAKEGRTVLFVSHNMATVENLCNKSILLEEGKLSLFSDTATAIDNYMSSGRIPKKTKLLTSADIDVSLNIINKDDNITNDIQCGQPMTFSLDIFPKRTIARMRIVLAVFNSHGQRLLDFDTWYQMKENKNVNERCKYLVKWSKNILRPGSYGIRLGFYENENYISGWENADNFRVLEGNYYLTGKLPNSGQGPILTDAIWIIEKQ